MSKMVVERRDEQASQVRETCYIITQQSWSGLVREVCGHCGVTVPAKVTHCPGCGRFITNR